MLVHSVLTEAIKVGNFIVNNFHMRTLRPSEVKFLAECGKVRPVTLTRANT
jgi:hypothetical protein